MARAARALSSSLAALGLLVACGCSPRQPAPAQPDAPSKRAPAEPDVSPAPSADAAAQLTALEDRVLAAASLSIDFTIESSGAVESLYRGRLRVAPPSVADVRAEGRYGGTPTEVFLVSDGQAMQGAANQRGFEQQTPPDLHEAMVLAFIRMGLLHHLAVLTAGSPPDGTHGTMRTMMTVREVARADDALSFAIFADGDRVGRATLWLDERGLPLRREQVVQFPGGEMRVHERYTALELE